MMIECMCESRFGEQIMNKLPRKEREREIEKIFEKKTIIVGFAEHANAKRVQTSPLYM